MFSNARGINIEGGRDDKITSTTIESNLFKGFNSNSGSAWQGVDISGTGASGSSASETQTTIRNNMFINTNTGITVNGQNKHTHTATITNNTIVNSTSKGLSFLASGSSTVNVNAKNNIISGTQGNACGAGYAISSDLKYYAMDITVFVR